LGRAVGRASKQFFFSLYVRYRDRKAERERPELVQNFAYRGVHITFVIHPFNGGDLSVGHQKLFFSPLKFRKQGGSFRKAERVRPDLVQHFADREAHIGRLSPPIIFRYIQ
jgi:hypothetical protein